MARKLAPLSAGAQAVYDAMVNAGKPITMAELKEAGVNANPAHFTALRNRGLITSEQIEVETVRTVKSKVNEYALVDGADLDEVETE